MVEDEKGRDPAIRIPGTTVILFPLTMISKRIERGEAWMCATSFAGSQFGLVIWLGIPTIGSNSAEYYAGDLHCRSSIGC